ncbi:hypothetical protein GCM10007388_28530 [Pseudoduganella plicata]|uniref:DUF2946 domain-containing protein n=2 Tax=Pseudoduganella plicata TaxID=321984 RepID=A0AA88C8Q9_9BURK|nr:hypothetical protein GCM10007388_28530 [Pseudoduganella plicata]
MLYWPDHVPRPAFVRLMRRFLVIFLILLFPLNVLALSTSVASMHGNAAGQSILADTFECKDVCDLDPDEPPTAGDMNGIVDRPADPCLAGSTGRAAVPHDALRHLHSTSPPVPPPRRG